MSKDNEFDRYDKIEKYVEGILSQNELADFEAEIKADEELAEEINIYKNISKIFEEEMYKEEVQDLRNTFNNIKIPNSKIATISKTKAPEKPNNNLRLIYFQAFAAAVILLMIIGLYLFFSKTSATPEKIYAQYAQYETLNLTSKSAAIDHLSTNLEKAFNQKNYITALELSQIYLQNNKDAYDVLLAKAIAEIELKQYDTALKTLEQLRQSDVRINKADWYEALIYLKKNDLETAQPLFRQIVQDKRFDYNKAQQILDELSK